MTKGRGSAGLGITSCGAAILLIAGFTQGAPGARANASSGSIQTAPTKTPSPELPQERTLNGSEIKRYEISDTAEGDQLADQVAARWEENYGVNANPDKLNVYDFGSGDSLDLVVVPSDMLVEEASTTVESGGGVRVSAVAAMAELVEEDSGDGTPSDLDALGTSSWQLERARCWSRVENGTGWFDHCFKMHRLTRDGNPDRDYYTLDHYGTAKSKGIWTLTSATLGSWRHPDGPAQNWVDWSPRADIIDVSACRTQGYSISAGGFGIGNSATICPEKWDIDKSSEGGRFENSWRGRARRAEREVGYMTAVNVAQGRYARFKFKVDFFAW